MTNTDEMNDWHRIADERSAEIVRLHVQLDEALQKIERLKRNIRGDE